MSYVSAALNTALDDLGISQTELAHRADIDRSILNRYTRDAVLGPENLEKLIAALSAPHDSALVAAYLRDMLPPSLAHLVSIQPQTDRVREKDPLQQQIIDTLAAVTPKLQKDTLYLLTRAARQNAIADIFHSTASILRGDA
jgi:transcriptional regulator with XRE-family HTH domain